jgi:hypothetical protein
MLKEFRQFLLRGNLVAAIGGRSALQGLTVNALLERVQTSGPVDKETRECPACLSPIPYAARRCAFCTEEVGAAPAPVAT